MSFEVCDLGVRCLRRLMRRSGRPWLAALVLSAVVQGQGSAQTASLTAGGSAAQGGSSVGGSGGVIPVRRATIDRERGPVPVTPP